jgi:Sodium:neurotransmitter symporter family
MYKHEIHKKYCIIRISTNSKEIYMIFSCLVDDKISITVVPISQLLSGDSLPSCMKDESLVENEETQQDKPYKRVTWSRGVEFLFSCIAMSVGLGNLWRFPFKGLLSYNQINCHQY